MLSLFITMVDHVATISPAVSFSPLKSTSEISQTKYLAYQWCFRHKYYLGESIGDSPNDEIGVLHRFFNVSIDIKHQFLK